ncbi:hypothetical protein [Sphingopyxis sp.]|uniref:hypothetical protein n=1 Tax=Sphingopyxis sp. TaxID=1908224 RepID=UPI002D76C3E3|nr:hypothetical protein [Sphingopyxis sp.]HET6526828.1 hypothetical protein [Sphingopyxis sp.]
MDMNQLFHHHQIALMTANRARQEGRALAGFNLAHHYVTRINRFRESRGLPPDFAGYSGPAPGIG